MWVWPGNEASSSLADQKSHFASMKWVWEFSIEKCVLCFLQLPTWFERATSGPSSGGGEGVYPSPKSAEGFALCYGQGKYKLVTYA